MKYLQTTDKESIAKNIAELFFALYRLNWTRSGTSLGMARQQAFVQIDEFIAEKYKKDKNNIVVHAMMEIVKANKNKWAKMVMNSKKSENTLNLSDKEKTDAEKKHGKEITAAKDYLTQKMKAFQNISDKNTDISFEKPETQIQKEQIQIPVPLIIKLLREQKMRAA